MIDCHCHLEYMEDDVIKETSLLMEAVITSVAHPKDAEKMLSIAAKYPNIYLALGLHPSEVIKFSDKEIEDYMNLIRKNKNNIIAIGEVGLDRHWIKDEEEHQRSRKVFSAFIELANELKIPLVIHTRDSKENNNGTKSAMDETLEMLKEAKVPVMMHCFSSKEHISECKKRGYYMSMNTILCKSKSYSKIARDCPVEMMVLETDAPWMDPESSELTNRPWKIEKSAEKIALLHNISKDEVLHTTTKNARKLFGI